MNKTIQPSADHTSIRLNEADRKSLKKLQALLGLTRASDAIRVAIREAVAKRAKK